MSNNCDPLIYDMIYILLQLGSQPVAVVQYTYTHTNNTENDTKQTIQRITQEYIEQHKN